MSTFWLPLSIALVGIIVLPILWRVWLYVLYFLYFFILQLSLYREVTQLLTEAPQIIERKIAGEEEARE